MRKAAISNNEFTFDIYQKLKSAPGNIFYSPYSIYCALAMTYAGAGGATAREMAEVLHFDPADVSQHNAMHVLQREIERCNTDITQLHIANAIWAQKGWDFAQDPKASCREINQWIRKRTNNLISEILQPGRLDDLTAMIVTNAIYFKARWPKPFDVSCTHNDGFYTLDGEEILVPMMKEGSCGSYTKGNNYQAIDLPYKGYDLNMIIIMPDEGQFSAFENCLDYPLFDLILQDLKHFDWRMPGNYTEINLSMPKFKFKSNYQLSEYLQALGMKDALEKGRIFPEWTIRQYCS
jgi:serpin B